jgi:hypothetical protein
MDVIEGVAHIFKIRCSNVFKCSLGLTFYIRFANIYRAWDKRFAPLYMISGSSLVVANTMATRDLHGH